MKPCNFILELTAYFLLALNPMQAYEVATTQNFHKPKEEECASQQTIDTILNKTSKGIRLMDYFYFFVNAYNIEENDPRNYIKPEETQKVLNQINLTNCSDLDKTMKLWYLVLNCAEPIADKKFFDVSWKSPKDIIHIDYSSDLDISFKGDTQDLSIVLASMLIQANVPNVMVATNMSMKYSWVEVTFNETYIFDLSFQVEKEKPKVMPKITITEKSRFPNLYDASLTFNNKDLYFNPQQLIKSIKETWVR